MRSFLSTVMLVSLMTLFCDASEMPADAREVLANISKYKPVWNKPPKGTPHRASVDGPLMGNGDMGVVIAGNPEAQQFLLCKNDMWRLQHGYGNASPVGFGKLVIQIPALKGASYKVTQDLATATTEGRFSLKDAAVSMKSYVAAGENLLVLEIAAEGGPFEAHAELHVAEGRGSESVSKRDGDLFWGKRAFASDVDIPSGVAAAWKMMGEKTMPGKGESVKSPAGATFTVASGKSVTLVLAMDSLFKHEHYGQRVRETLKTVDRKRLKDVRAAHKKWWAEYYARSYVRINDPVIEHQYYLSLYGMGSCSRDPDFPPGIFGWVTSDKPAWHGDYHLNYNHQAPFYGLARANRLEQADPHDTPVLDFMERAKWHCKEIFGFEGVMYPVGIGPKGIATTYGNAGYIKRGPRCAENKGLFFGQRTNGAYALVNMAPRWYATYDPDYGKKIYPLVLQIATFWENYVVWDEAGKRFIIEKDSVHEGSGQDMNSCLSIALAKNALLLALDMSKTLKVDAGRRDRWSHIARHLSGYTFQEKNGRQVFRYTEKGTAWWVNNTLGIQQIYPAGQIHLDSDPALLEVSRNTIDVMGRWLDGNGSNSFFPAAVRVGHDPEVILAQLRRYCRHTRPNGFQAGNPHGIENFSTVPNTINEMLCMGHMGVLRLFPVWPKGRDASFSDIRCWGAFLVTAERKDGDVRYVKITSERGRDCTMINPWPGRKVVLTRPEGVEVLEGARFKFKTKKDESVILRAHEHPAATADRDKTAWFAGKWGVFFHYLANPAGQKNMGLSADEWNRQIDGFDVKGLARQIRAVGADYFVITIGQGSGHYLANNRVYDGLTGIRPSKCSRRDLVSDLADALNPLGIKLLVYTASDIGWGDLEARKALGMKSHHNDHLVGLRKRGVRNDWKKNREGQVAFLKNWVKIHEQWSRQWGRKVAGWWVDGCYHADVRFPEDEPPNLKTLKDAVLTGNPHAIVTFNSGTGVRYYSKHEDYTAGEIARGLPACPGPWVEKDGHKLRYHVLTYLGRTWGLGDPRYGDEAVAKFAADITSRGGFVSFDVPPRKNGLMPEPFLRQLKAVGKAVKGIAAGKGREEG